MPLKRVALANKQSTTNIPFGEDSLHIVWRPYIYTPEMEKQLTQIEADSSAGRAFAEALSRMIVSWDYLDEKDKPVKLDVETLSREPTRFLSEVLQGLAASLRPPAPSSTTSTFG